MRARPSAPALCRSMSPLRWKRSSRSNSRPMQLPSGRHAFDWLIGRPIAHRGLHDSKRGVIENTRSAFAAAIASNYSIECDVQLTADSEAVVFHDDTLDRLTLAQGPLITRTAAELKSVAFRSSSDRIGTLAD